MKEYYSDVKGDGLKINPPYPGFPLPPIND
jgi:hypothetical protein